MFGWQSFWGLVLNSWTLWQYPHTMLGAVQTGCFAMAAISAFCLLSGANEEYGRTFVRIGVLVGVVASVLQLWPTGDGQGAMIARHQPGRINKQGRRDKKSGSHFRRPRRSYKDLIFPNKTLETLASQIKSEFEGPTFRGYIKVGPTWGPLRSETLRRPVALNETLAVTSHVSKML
jgi:hypothetical protein